MATDALIPGGGGDPWEWHRIVPELESRGHEALAIRLTLDEAAAGSSEYAEAVVNAIGSRDEVIVVAESMGGFTAPIVCTRRRLDLLVLLNAMIPVPGESFNDWGSSTGAGRDDRLFPLEFQRRIARERLGLGVDEIDGGHMVALGNPKALADMLETYRHGAARARR